MWKLGGELEVNPVLGKGDTIHLSQGPALVILCDFFTSFSSAIRLCGIKSINLVNSIYHNHIWG